MGFSNSDGVAPARHDPPGPLRLGGIEAGGTKFLCAMADQNGGTLSETLIATTSPSETLTAATDFFRAAQAEHGPMTALSIGSFGPLSLDPRASDYGCITSTPKPGWQSADLLGRFKGEFAVPIALDTDVNCAAIGEHLLGSGRGVETFCYVTVGTGIGVGIYAGGMTHGGANHPEAGHIRLPRAPDDGDFPGVCPFHGDCLEGLASGPAIAARWEARPELLPADHPAWAIEVDYLAGLCATLTYVVRPSLIVLGGGVMQSGLYDRVRRATAAKLGGYDANASALDMDRFIVAPTAGPSAGLTGALALAYRMATTHWPSHWKAATLASGSMGSIDA